MYFSGRLLDEISDDEIERIVTEHTCERESLEFKMVFNNKNDEDRLEILKDIASMANSGGGYIFIGVRDDGKGRAQKFESLEEKTLQSFKRSISNLANDHIEERISGLTLLERQVNGNNLLVIRVPPSNRTPHMVTFQNHTHFCKRYHDGKREMTMAELRSAFNDDLIFRRLDNLERIIQTGRRKRNPLSIVESAEDMETWSPGNKLAMQRMESFKKSTGDSRYFYMSITPLTDNEKALVDINSKELEALCRSAPGSRNRGWCINRLSEKSQFGTHRVTYGGDLNNLTVFSTAHVEFYSPIDTSFCWMQEEDEFKRRPRLYPYAVIEYPLSFLKFYKEFAQMCALSTEEIRILLLYWNIQGTILCPYAPGSPFYSLASAASDPFAKKEFVIDIKKQVNELNPDETAFQLVRAVYASFGLRQETIPFYDSETKQFVIK